MLDRQGITLVEVLTSTALLSILLVGMLTAYSRHVRQINRAEELTTAVKLADQLLADWFRSDQDIYEYESGVFEDQPDYHWHLVSRPSSNSSQSPTQILTLKVSCTRQGAESDVVAVDLLAPVRPIVATGEIR